MLPQSRSARLVLSRRIRGACLAGGLGLLLAGGAALATAPPLLRVSVSTAGVQGDDHSHDERGQRISADGRYVAFTSNATTLVPGDTNRYDDIFVRDRLTNSTVRVSVSSTGEEADLVSRYPDISADGRFVVFVSSATDLVPGDTNGVPDLFLHDRDADGNGIFDESGRTSTERVNVSSTGAVAAGGTLHCTYPVISGDGRFIAFESDDTNLGAGRYERSDGRLPAGPPGRNHRAGQYCLAERQPGQWELRLRGDQRGRAVCRVRFGRQ
jgi:hypothetical protein